MTKPRPMTHGLIAFTIAITTASMAGAAPPSITNVSPNKARRPKANLSIALTGDSTHFVQGTTVVDFGQGITVNSITVLSATSLVVQISISPTASPAPRAFLVTTGAESVGVPNGFTALLPEQRADFDGDGRSDVSVYRPSTGGWYFINSSNGTVNGMTWGTATDIPVVGDFDHDFKSDITVYRPSTGSWFILLSSSNFTASRHFTWGTAEDIPVPADYDGDDVDDVAVFRPSSGAWFVLLSTLSFADGFALQWGASGDVPVAGDYDADGRADIAVFRPSTGMWAILKSSTNFTGWFGSQWGVDGDVPFPGDYDGDGLMDFVVYRPSMGFWFFLKSTFTYTFGTSVGWGVPPGDVPVAADYLGYPGEALMDIAVYRPSTGTWFIANGGERQWGVAGDIPLPKRP